MIYLKLSGIVLFFWGLYLSVGFSMWLICLGIYIFSAAVLSERE